jgi:hypothetical protein
VSRAELRWCWCYVVCGGEFDRRRRIGFQGALLLNWKRRIMKHTVLIVIICFVLNICVAHSEPKKESDFDRATKAAVDECGSKSNDSTYIKCLSEQRDAIILVWKMGRAQKIKIILPMY